MPNNLTRKQFIPGLLFAAILASAVFGLPLPAERTAQAKAAEGPAAEGVTGREIVTNEPGDAGTTVYVPYLGRRFPWRSPFGFEYNGMLSRHTVFGSRARDLNAGWARMNGYVSWRTLQPVENGEIDWGALAGLDQELRWLNEAGIAPILIVDDYPLWAVRPDARDDGQLTSCAPLQSDKYDDFAAFMAGLAKHFKEAGVRVQNWEIGNEVDVDPDLVEPNTMFGCWGDMHDPFYGGRAYGEMLKVVSPAIKAVDASAQIWVGGLLLDNPNSNGDRGRPELFLKGILEAGAAPAFDVLPFHWYPPYVDIDVDYDNELATVWYSQGGGVLGKANFLRQIMSEYGVDKPLVLNEAALTCPEQLGGQPAQHCLPPGPRFYEMQADYIVRTFLRGLHNGVDGFIWYTLNGPGWRSVGLLNEVYNPYPSYHSLRTLIAQTENGAFAGPVDYGPQVEAYAFDLPGGKKVHIIWAKTYGDTVSLSFPQASFSAAYERSGNPITPTLKGSTFDLQASFHPIYVVFQ